MTRKQKKAKNVKVVHFLSIKGLWSHFFALCTLALLVVFILSPFTDWNPTWVQPQDHPSYHTALDTIQGIKGIPIRFIKLGNKERGSVQTKGETMYLRPGQTIRLIFSNSGPAGIYDITIPGYKIYAVGWNNTPLEQVVAQDQVSVLPGKNLHVLFTPTWYGTLPVTAFYRSSGYDKYTEVRLLTIQVQGLPMLPSPLPIKLSQ